ncbi:UNVERIFIED_CONTAM: Transcription factor [Sesamum angustifolium]|uniref:Transcription factor n=1 Tax=Sesamum angustifolium TaxID=2727405 RepID=A0AAW2RKF2_9LAMI
MVRAARVDEKGLRKGAWTEEEDNRLRAYILRYGHWNWRLLPRFAGLDRCGKSCRLRWMNYLKPGLKRGSYTKHEQDLIAKLHDELGNKYDLQFIIMHGQILISYVQLSNFMCNQDCPGRTDNEIKNYWHTHFKKRSERVISKSDPDAGISREEQSSSEITHFLNASTFDKAQEIHRKHENAAADNRDSDSCAEQNCSEILSGSSPVALDREGNDEYFPSFSDSYSGFHEGFWEEPFMVDLETTYSQEYKFCILGEEGLSSPYISCFDDFAVTLF